MKKTNAARGLPIIIVFLVTTTILLIVPSLDFLWNMDRVVMLAGNAILFLATMAAFTLYRKSLRNNSPHAFLRMVYGGMFAKLMICLVAALVYIMIVKKDVSKGAIFGCMFLYLVYTYMEVSTILKLSGKDAKKRGAA